MIKELFLTGLFAFPNVVAVPTVLSLNHNTVKQLSGSEQELNCLALNMYHEARGESTAGILAVSYVVLNRVNDPRFPNTICEVVYQGHHIKTNDGTFQPIRNKCQFSWYCDGKSDQPKNERVYNRLVSFSKYILSNINTKQIDITDGALFYHANYVSPSWSKTKQKTIEIGVHVFYR
jgi:spore germination cell wall hydrolase CwlJ-like protein